MQTNKHGYVPAAVLLRNMMKEMRDHVEYEKFVCRILKDDDRTRTFKENTQNHKNSIHRMNYNNPAVDKYTAAAANEKREADNAE